MRVICFCDGIIEILFWGLFLLFFYENFTLLQKCFILQTTSLSSFCFSKAWVSSEFMRSGREKKAEAGWQRRENPQGWEGDGLTGLKDYVDPWPTLRESSRISRRKCWTGHLDVEPKHGIPSLHKDPSTEQQFWLKSLSNRGLERGLLLLLSHFSCVRLWATPWTAAYQAPPSMGSSRQEYWSGVWLPSPERGLAWAKYQRVFGDLCTALEVLSSLVMTELKFSASPVDQRLKIRCK